MIREPDIKALKELLAEDNRSEIPIARSFLEDIADKFEGKPVIKTENCSQACPVCKRPVNQKHCGNCGQTLRYGNIVRGGRE